MLKTHVHTTTSHHHITVLIVEEGLCRRALLGWGAGRYNGAAAALRGRRRHLRATIAGGICHESLGGNECYVVLEYALVLLSLEERVAGVHQVVAVQEDVVQGVLGDLRNGQNTRVGEAPCLPTTRCILVLSHDMPPVCMQ
jgi:hypothetical protein